MMILYAAVSSSGWAMHRSLTLMILSVAALVPAVAPAGIVDTPDCRRDLAAAHERIHAVRLRENTLQPGDFLRLCRVLRQNLQDMTQARDPMARCMTGHDRGENVAQMDASIDDIRFVIGKHCGSR
jgi:hypothetical protein